MKIDSIKTNLRNIVLLAEEYKEEVPNSLDKEIKETEVAIKNGRDLNEYDKQFFNTIQQYKRNTFEQIIYFAERVFLELAAREKDGRYTRGFNSEFFIDKNKFNSLMKILPKDEAKLVESACDMLLNTENFRPHMEKLLENAIRLSSKETSQKLSSKKVETKV